MQLPTVFNATRIAMQNRHALEQSEAAGCYHCLKVFDPKEIKNYTDQNQTALCPHCHVDAVIPSGIALSFPEDYLQRVHDYWIK